MIKHNNRCTLCLSLNKRTLNIFRTNLQYVYENLANLKVRSETWMCFICHERLRQCHLLQQLAINTRGLIADVCEVGTKFESLLELSTSDTRIICLPSPCETQYAAAIKTEPDETSEVHLNDTEMEQDEDVETTNYYNEDGEQNPGSSCADSEKNNLICDDDTSKVDRNNSRQTKKELLLIIEKLSPSIIAKFVRSTPEKRRDEHFEEGEFTSTSTKKNKQEIEEVLGDTERRKEKENEPEYINQLEKLNETSSDDSFHNEFGTSKNPYLKEVNQTGDISPNEGITHDINNQSQIKDNANHSITRRPESSNVRYREDYCYYCETFVLNFARHLLRHHIYETEVKKILSKPKKSLDRKRLIAALRKKGNYLVNSKETNSDDSFHNEFGTSKNSYFKEVNQTGDISPNEGITHDINNQSQIKDNANHSITIIRRRRPESSNVQYREDYCYYCETFVLNFARHLLRHHIYETEVQKILSKPKKSLDRKQLIAALRKKGNYLVNSKEVIKPMRKQKFTDYLPCTECLGFYSKKLLWKHKKKCSGKTGCKNIQSEAQNLLIRHLKIDEKLKDIVFPRMRPDKISLIAKKDILICAFGSQYLKTHREKHCVNVVSRKMRELAKLLIELRKIDPSINDLFAALRPNNYDILVEATKILGKYDIENDRYETPTLAMNMSTTLKHCCNIAIMFALKKQGPYTEVDTGKIEADLKTLIQLIESNWKYNLSTQNEPVSLLSTENKTRKGKKRTLVPWTKEQKDVVTKYFRFYIKNHIPPKRHECEKLKEQHVDLLNNKDWLKIKVFVQNIYSKKLKKANTIIL